MVQRTVRLEGVHHITLITGDAPRNVDFYTRVLGLRLVKKTVNQDDPTVYHLFYADEQGSAGSDITFFEYPGARRGTAGRGDGAHDRLAGRLAGGARLLGGSGCRTRPVRGAPSESVCASRIRRASRLRASRQPTRDDEPLVARHPEIPEEHALQGFDGVRAFAIDPERSSGLLEETLGFEPRGDYTWEARGEQRGGFYAYDAAPDGARHPGRRHRPPRRVGDDDGGARRVAAARRRGRADRRRRVIDRFYFKSVYFREPNGILFELATLGPGFATDEDPEHLGERLSLPPDFEHLREQIEPVLTPLPNPRAA